MQTVILNGFGRIGKLFVQHYQQDRNPTLKLVAINDLKSKSDCEHAYIYDSVYGRSTQPLGDYDFRSEKSLNDLLIDYPKAIVVEATGKKRDEQCLRDYLSAGAHSVILSAPGRGHGIKTVCYGINHQTIRSNDLLISHASCTTNALAPIIFLLKEHYVIESLFLTTVHAATNDQCIQDSIHSDSRRARSIFNNLIPTKTGAKDTIKEIFPDFHCPFHTLSIRSPHQSVSLLDLSIQLKQEVSVKQLKELFVDGKKRLPGILDYQELPLVSSDFKGDKHSVIIDGPTLDSSGESIKILGWYDNEYGYAHQLYALVSYLAQK